MVKNKQVFVSARESVIEVVDFETKTVTEYKVHKVHTDGVDATFVNVKKYYSSNGFTKVGTIKRGK
jgi:hypothetical protein